LGGSQNNQCCLRSPFSEGLILFLIHYINFKNKYI
jgi:hypothetical protein